MSSRISFRSFGSNCQSLTKRTQPGAEPGVWRESRRIADVGPGREVAVLVLKDAVEDQKLLAAAVGMSRETAVGHIANDRGGARHLAADAVEHPPVDAGDRRRGPGEVPGMDDDPLQKIGIEFHSLPRCGGVPFACRHVTARRSRSQMRGGSTRRRHPM